MRIVGVTIALLQQEEDGTGNCELMGVVVHASMPFVEKRMTTSDASEHY